MQNSPPIDLILYPFPVKSTKDLILFKVEGEYELRFTDDVFSVDSFVLMVVEQHVK